MSTLRAQVGAFPSSKGTILVLSSNLSTSASVSEILRRAGYIVDLSGEETNRTKMQLAAPEVVILIGCNGQWLEHACSAISWRTPNVLLMVLGPDDVDTRVRLFEIGADAYLAEPFAPAELLARIASLLRAQKCISREACPRGR
jgi:DNA-binding response OmpR family regulator